MNSELKKEVAFLEEERERKEAEVGLLRSDLENGSWTREEESGREFIQRVPETRREKVTDEDVRNEENEKDEGFKGLSLATILLISASSAIVFTIAISFLPPVRKMEKRERDEREQRCVLEKETNGKSSRGEINSYDDIDLG